MIRSCQLSAVSSQPGVITSAGTNQCCQHPFYLDDSGRKTLIISRFENPEITSQEQVILQLTRRTDRYLQKSSEFSITLSTRPFGNVCAYRSRCAAHLGGETVELFLRKRPASCVNLNRDSMCLLPHFEISETLHEVPSALTDS